jgi:hypothetical protein
MATEIQSWQIINDALIPIKTTMVDAKKKERDGLYGLPL